MGLCLEKLSPQQRLDYFSFGFVFEEPGDDGLGLAAVLVAFPLAGVARAVLLLFLAATVLVADFLTAFFAATFFAEAFFAATFLAACFLRTAETRLVKEAFSSSRSSVVAVLRSRSM